MEAGTQWQVLRSGILFWIAQVKTPMNPGNIYRYESIHLFLKTSKGQTWLPEEDFYYSTDGDKEQARPRYQPKNEDVEYYDTAKFDVTSLQQYAGTDRLELVPGDEEFQVSLRIDITLLPGARHTLRIKARWIPRGATKE